ncbi:hypothetical protein [Sphingomonas japonica]|uniref:Class 3 adenylate cyclase n=1 Tax=Sphingomonas japonica TaxID=511662 RepID=A0ABX0TYA5_9SPHN|nr:hypothetical protein [Sphingomonas japonica]NIJ23214.1 class 3 adenylate cyclase [Sphingomonas japonica]
MADEPEARENEIMAAAKAAKKRSDAVAKLREPGDQSHWPLQAIGIGVGSAALAAALLWVKSTRDRK